MAGGALINKWLRLAVTAWIIAVLVGDLMPSVDAQRPSGAPSPVGVRRQQRPRRHRTDKAKLIRDFLKKNGRLEGMVRLINGPNAHAGSSLLHNHKVHGSDQRLTLPFGCCCC